MKDKRVGKNYVLIYRHLKMHKVFFEKNPLFRLFFMDMIIDAAYKDHDTEWRGVGVFLKRGQWLGSIRRCCRDYRVSEKTISRWLQVLKTNNMIDTWDIVSDPNIAATPESHDAAAPMSPPRNRYGIVVTVTEYNKWQSFSDSNSKIAAAPMSQEPATPMSELHKEVVHSERKNQKEGNTEFEKNSFKKLTTDKLFEIWNEERGPLQEITTGYRPASKSAVKDLIDHFNHYESLGSEPEEKWRQFVKHAAQSIHQEHMSWMTPFWLSKDINHVDEVLANKYNKSFSGESNGKQNGKSRLSNKGSLEAYRESAKGLPLFQPAINPLLYVRRPGNDSGTK